MVVGGGSDRWASPVSVYTQILNGYVAFVSRLAPGWLVRYKFTLRCVCLSDWNTDIGEKEIGVSKKRSIFSIYVFLRRSRKKSKYRWFKVEGLGGGGLVGRWWWWWWSSLSCPVSQRESCVKLRKTFRYHVNEAGGGSSAAKLFALEFSCCNTYCNCAWLLIRAAQLCRRNSDRNEEKTVVKLQTAV